MADIVAEETPKVAEEPEVPKEEKPLDPMEALKDVLRTALFHDGLARGLHECVKVLDRGSAHLCVLAKDIEEQPYEKLITALCREHKTSLIHVASRRMLGEMAGLCKRNKEGHAVKVVGCSCVVVKSWGEETRSRHVILEHIKGGASE